MGSLVSIASQINYTHNQLNADNEDEEESLLIDRYNNEIKLGRLTTEQVKDKIIKFMKIYSSPNRQFYKLKEYIGV